MPKIVDHAAYRHELLRRTTAVFLENGYAEVSMRDIAGAIDVSTGTLYHYFPSKEELFCHLFLFHARESSAQLVNDLCGVEGRKRRLDRLFDFFLRECDGMRTQFLLSADMVRHQLPPKAMNLVNRWSTNLKRRLGELIGVDQTTREMIFCFLSGTLYTRIVSGEGTDLAPVFHRFRKMLEA
ncbi:MAG: TetR/AcrR family transcriptional regulator [Leptospiraceae bacterium]|nr:TetR/AcrR family transcriptional regulator [Leptospiraceae bacterium]